jgi:predicted nucleic acid-binding protein
MTNNRYILDANVFLEYIYDRPLKAHSTKLLQEAILKRIEILVPSLFLDEITEVFCGNLNDIEKVERHLRYIEELAKQNVLHIVVPNYEVRMKAVEIARIGSKKSGFPEFTDSLYHALAILNDAVFVTNDKKHIRKVEKFGHIIELSELQ